VILILGGTAEARVLASELHSLRVPVTTSLAGRVQRPVLPAGEVRVGGFGGPEKLARWLHDNFVSAVVDATHPFAERITASAAQACAASGMPLLRLERPGWSERPGDRWTWVDDLDQAAGAIDGLGERVLLTTGRQGLPAFAPIESAWFLIRCVDPPDPPLPPQNTLILDRGPYTLDSELALLDGYAIDLVITKDSGGELTVAKLDAARERKLPVIIVRRPRGPETGAVAEVQDAVDWVLSHRHAG
jgi:precorrin-6A/cobalt-precorrin-6A reductase